MLPSILEAHFTLNQLLFLFSTTSSCFLYNYFDALFLLYFSNSFQWQHPLNPLKFLQAALNKILVEKYHHECKIPANCSLEVLGPQYKNWKSDPSIISLGSIVMSELHLQNLRLPLLPFFHNIFAIHDIHPLQLSTNAIRIMSRFVLLNLIKDLGPRLADFHLCYVRVRSGKTPKYFFTPRKGWVCFLRIPLKDIEPKHHFLLSRNWKSPSVNHSLFPIRRGFNYGNSFSSLNFCLNV